MDDEMFELQKDLVEQQIHESVARRGFYQAMTVLAFLIIAVIIGKIVINALVLFGIISAVKGF